MPVRVARGSGRWLYATFPLDMYVGVEDSELYFSSWLMTEI